MIEGKYIDFGAFYGKEPNHWMRSVWIMEVRDWLVDQCGKEDIDWGWSRGNRIAQDGSRIVQGVIIKDMETAIVFKLRFQV